ncbi:MAG: dihydroorotate dehydrogenase electron transfer subunit [Spirochaetales bacterium]|nr:dihydroorotate dehydrogenase electron transfer subunit [Spirochaetales bacterium]
MTRQFNSTVLANTKLSEDYFELELEWPTDLIKPEAGQFVSIKSNYYGGSLLKRPFAIAAFSGSSFSMLIQRRGPATSGFSRLAPGEEVNVTGPLGNFFPLPDKGRTPVLLGGGIGLGPILYLAGELLTKGLKPLLVLGYRNKDLIPDLCGKKLPETVICTDDGSSGFAGTVVGYLEQHIPDKSAVLYACGPDKMLEACEAFCSKNGNPLWISVEQMMACGIGACMGCVVPVHDSEKGFVRVCKEGPIFAGGYIKWT